LRVVVVAVGRVRGPLAAVVKEYEERARRYWKLETIEVSSGVRGGAAATPAQILAAEEERVLARIPPGLDVVALTRLGDEMSSAELAAYLRALGMRSAPGATFVIGGAFGLGERVLARATRRLSLSALTLPHEMARAVLAEQLYRAGTIVRGEPYHKGGEARSRKR
jgi:23S rRNA (pseudouridine1915-N3)-methyltransferase